MSIDVSKIKPGDTVTLEIVSRGLAGTYTITGTVYEGLRELLVAGQSLHHHADRSVIDHEPVWREPEGWQEWDGLSIDGLPHPIIRNRSADWYSRDSLWSDIAIREAMHGKTVTRLYLTEQAPA